MTPEETRPMAADSPPAETEPETDRLPQRVLVCGGRDYQNKTRLFAELDALRETIEIAQIIEGEAPGADTLARKYGEARGIPVRKFPADWQRYGRSAGHKRNAQMLKQGRPHLVVAFPGGPGTAGMIRLARNAGVPVKILS